MLSVWSHIALLDAASGVVRFGISWLVQSTILIIAGLMLAHWLRAKGPALQSAIYRTTFVAVLACPLATLALARAGVSGWSMDLPQAWAYRTEGTLVAPPELFGGKYVHDPVHEDLPASVIAEESALSADATHADSQARIDLSSELFIPSEGHTTSAPTIRGKNLAIRVVGWLTIASAVTWLLIGVSLLARLAIAWRRLATLCRDSAPVDEAVIETCRGMAESMGTPAPDVRVSPFVSGPCLAGFWQAIVLLPEGEVGVSVRDALIHELAHLRRHDVQWNLVRRLATAVFFFSPLLWRLSRRMEAVAEEVCDDYVVSHGTDRERYAHALVDIAELTTTAIAPVGVGMVSSRSEVAQRVARIMDISRPISTRVGRLQMLIVLLSGLVATATVGLVGLGSGRLRAESQLDHVEEQIADHNKDSAADQTAESKDTEVLGEPARSTISIHGRVLDTEGRPIASAAVGVTNPSRERFEPQTTQTNADGSFELVVDRLPYIRFGADSWPFATIYAAAEGFAPAFRAVAELESMEQVELPLIHDDIPIRGQVLDLQGRPVPEAVVHIGSVIEHTSGSMDEWLKLRRDNPMRAMSFNHHRLRQVPSKLFGLRAERGTLETGDDGNPLIRVDEEGFFQIRGIGRDRVVTMVVGGTHIQRDVIKVLTRTRIDDEFQLKGDYSQLQMIRGRDTWLRLYPATFEHVTGPGISISGLVRDRATKQPIAGIRVTALMSTITSHASATTDKNGRYELMGLPLEGTLESLEVRPEKSGTLPYPTVERTQLTYSASAPLNQNDTDFDLVPGFLVRVRATEKSTKRPLISDFYYFAHPDNENLRELNYSIRQNIAGRDADGQIKLVALPGPGAIAVQLPFGNDSRVAQRWYRRAAREDFGLPITGNGYLRGAQRGLISTSLYAAATSVNISSDGEPAEIALEVDPLTDITNVRCIDALRRPVEGVRVTGFRPWTGEYFEPGHVGMEVSRGEAKYIEIAALNEPSRRPVIFRHYDNQHAAILFATTDTRSPRVSDLPRDMDDVYLVPLKPAGTLVGSMVDGNGERVTNTNVQLRLISNVAPHEPEIVIDHGYVDSQGQFKIECIPAGGTYALYGTGPISDRVLSAPIHLAIGEVIDVGTLKVDVEVDHPITTDRSETREP